MRLAVLGSPVGHSLSPAMHEAALADAGLSGSYQAWDVDTDGCRAAIEEIRSGSLTGANVTMPHKALAYELSDVRSPEAERAGAVNTLSAVGGEVIGTNTDIAGIAAAWKWKGLPETGPINLLGSGGAAAAALVALAGRDIWVVARSPNRAVSMIERAGVEATVREWSSPWRRGALVNATPIGMRGEPVSGDALESATALFDMAYGDSPTPAVVAIGKRGLPVAEGLDMLIGQAVVSFRTWTGISPNPDVMRAAAEAELSSRRPEVAP